jgi:cytochrome d ubiquinol oxidase subunit II
MDLAYLWFFIVGVLFVGYFVLDGFDFGVGMSLPFLGKDEVSRRQVINTIGPVWDLNETWVIVAGACLFAAFPEWYATLFSGFYLPLLLILLALIARGVSFEYRHQRDDLRWKRRFDWMITIGSACPRCSGASRSATSCRACRSTPTRTSPARCSLLNPYGLWVGVTTLLLFFLHGVYFVGLKTDGQVHHDAQALGEARDPDGDLRGRNRGVDDLPRRRPRAAAVGRSRRRDRRGRAAASVVVQLADRDGKAFAAGAVTIVFAVLTLWLALFPYVMPSTNDPANSLTISNASSTPMTLQIMSWAALIFLPLVLAYQAWTYWIFRKRVTRSMIEKAEATAH